MAVLSFSVTYRVNGSVRSGNPKAGVEVIVLAPQRLSAVSQSSLLDSLQALSGAQIGAGLYENTLESKSCRIPWPV